MKWVSQARPCTLVLFLFCFLLNGISVIVVVHDRYGSNSAKQSAHNIAQCANKDTSKAVTSVFCGDC